MGDREPVGPLVRVEDASLLQDDGPVRVTVGRLGAPQAVADALATAGARSRVVAGRLTAVTTPSRLTDAVGRALGRPTAEALTPVLEAALAAWEAPPPVLATSAGDLASTASPLVMGVLNVTPDSFSDGGAWYRDGEHPDAAITRGRELAAAGAGIIDVGGESTRPGAEEVPVDEELARTVPVVEALAADGIVVSIDTRRSAVARAAADVGAVVVNDVSAGVADPEMLDLVADLGLAFVAMHMRGTPQTMRDQTDYDDVVGEVFDHLAERVEACVGAGIDPARVAVDPGLGFAKTAEQSLVLLRRLRELTSLGRPVVVGASRKSFIGHAADVDEPAERLPGSLAAATIAVLAGIAVVRTHDVAETLQAVRVARAVASAE